MKALLVFLGVVNLIALAAMGIDKALAKMGTRRIPEKVLFFFVLLLGGIGGTLGMHLFHHKTRHTYFRVGFPLIAVIEYGMLIYYLLTI